MYTCTAIVAYPPYPVNPYMMVKENNLSEIRSLILAGMPPNDRDPISGDAMLHAAGKYDKPKVAKLMLDIGANVNVRNKITQETPLHVAAYRGGALVTELLLERGGDAMALDKGGVTPLDVATRQNHPEVVKLLLKYGAKVISREDDGKHKQRPFAKHRRKIRKENVVTVSQKLHGNRSVTRKLKRAFVRELRANEAVEAKAARFQMKIEKKAQKKRDREEAHFEARQKLARDAAQAAMERIMKQKQEVQKKRDAEYLRMRNEKYGVWSKLGRMSWLWSVKTNKVDKSRQEELNYMNTVNTIAKNIALRDAAWQREVGDAVAEATHAFGRIVRPLEDVREEHAARVRAEQRAMEAALENTKLAKFAAGQALFAPRDDDGDDDDDPELLAMMEKQEAAERKKKIERAKAQGMDEDSLAQIVAELEAEAEAKAEERARARKKKAKKAKKQAKSKTKATKAPFSIFEDVGEEADAMREAVKPSGQWDTKGAGGEQKDADAENADDARAARRRERKARKAARKKKKKKKGAAQPPPLPAHVAARRADNARNARPSTAPASGTLKSGRRAPQREALTPTGRAKAAQREARRAGRQRRMSATRGAGYVSSGSESDSSRPGSSLSGRLRLAQFR